MLNVLLTSLALLTISVANVPLTLLTGTIPKPLGLMITQSFLKHYNVILSETMLSSVFSAFTVALALGNLIGTIFFIPLMDQRGRKFLAVHVRCTLLLLACLLQITSYYISSVECFLLSLLLDGIIFPTTLMAAVMMIIDCSNDKWRGFFSSFPGTGAAIGAFMVSMLSQPSWFGNDNWVAIPIISFVLTIPCYFYLVYFSHESPKWLLAHKTAAKAREAVVFYQGNSVDADTVLLKIKKELRTSSAEKLSWTECMRDDVLRSSILLIMLITSVMNVSSMNYEGMFAVTIYNILGLSTEKALTFNSIASVSGLFLSFVGSFLLDRLGRRPMASVMCMSVLLKDVLMSVALWTSFANGPNWFTSAAGIVNRLLSVVFAASGGSCLGSLLIGEMIPPAARVSTAQMIQILPILISIPLGALFPITLTWFPPALYLVFMIIHPMMIIYIFRNLPETKNQAVCDIVADVAETVISRRNTRRSTLISECDGLLKRKQSNTYRSIE